MTAFDRDGLIRTEDPEMIRVLKTAENVANSRATVLLRGESGTGKELLARFIHAKSTRAAKRLIAVNCAAVPEGLLESELFGFEKGAFTGAHQSKPGKFELAHDSTLLLDEVSEMPLLLQAKLLRVIQEGEIERLGARSPLRVNVRLIATSNRDLSAMVRRGEFREDLFYRLNVVPLQIPPLRERPRDIHGLAKFFTQVSNHLNGRAIQSISDAALQKLMTWKWPGNVRELENVIERAVLLCQGNQLDIGDIEISGYDEQKSEAPVAGGLQINAGTTVQEMERLLILKTLEHTQQNRSRAAVLLGISIRTLRNKLHEYGDNTEVNHG